MEAEDAFTIVAGQRDKLRQRLLAMEGATSFEIDRLNTALREANAEIHALRQLTGGPSSTAVLFNNHATNNDSEDKADRPLLLMRQGMSQEALVEVVDRASSCCLDT